MGYDIYIGEAGIYPAPDEVGQAWEYGRPAVHITVRDIERDDAPAFPGDEMSHHANHRHPSYTVWGEFARSTGLHDLFFGDDGLMSEHPGAQAFNAHDVQQVQAALATFQQQHRGATPQFGNSATDADATLARLLWLEWWMRWAVENCRVPTLYNH